LGVGNSRAATQPSSQSAEDWAVEAAFRETFHLWADERFDALWGRGMLASRYRVSREAMEDYPRERYALLTLIAVETSHVEVTDADGTHYRPRCLARQAERLKPGDVVIVNHVNPSEELTVVERVTTQGERDGCQYELFELPLALKSKPA
jgi:hypothetical protein